MLKKFNDRLGDLLSNTLSSMIMFYGVAFLVIFILIFQKPNNLVEWIQYIVAVFFQGVALPVLAYTSKKSGDIQANLLSETHDTVMNELKYIKEQQIFSKKEIESQRKIIIELKEIIKKIHNIPETKSK